MINEYERGKTASLYCTFSTNDVPADPTGLQLTIYYQNTIKVAASSPTKISDGFYFKEVSIANDWDLDYYAVLWTGTLAGVAFKKTDYFKVVKSVTEGDVSVPATSYCTVGDVERELRGVDLDTLPNFEDDCAQVIQYYDHYIEMETGISFKSVSRLAYLDGTGTPILVLPQRPITELTACAIRSTPNTDIVDFDATKFAYINCVDEHGVQVRTPSTDAQTKTANLFVDCVEGKLIIPESILYVGEQVGPFWDYVFSRSNTNIKVEFTYGYSAATRPYEIRLLASKLVAIEFLMQHGDQLSSGAVGVGFPMVSRSYAGMPYAARIERLQAQAEIILAKYRNIGVN